MSGWRRPLLIAFAALAALRLGAINASDRYRSPRNPERKVREATTLIVLHTTEAPARGSLNKLCDRGECHFVVDEDGAVYRIVDRDKEAFHAGRSMWNGKEDVDKFSVGIECVGYHNKPMPTVQLDAIKQLVKELKSMYKVTDDRVVCHSHVAYGAPNKYHKKKHRGRKRCGMLFATPTVRRLLGLTLRPKYDPDIRARRLVQADPYLNSILYGKVDPMVKHYPKAVKQKSEPPKKSPPAVSQAAAKPSAKPSAVAPAAGEAPPKSVPELIKRGWKVKGVISRDQTAIRIAGDRWNAADTYYTIRDKVFPGNQVDPKKFEKGMSVWRKP